MKTSWAEQRKQRAEMREGNGGGSPPCNNGHYGTAGALWEAKDLTKTPAAQKQGSRGNNSSGPPAFAQSSKLNDLLREHPMVQLGMVATTAGFNGTDALPMEEQPQRSFLLWICSRNAPTRSAPTITLDWLTLPLHSNCITLYSPASTT